MSVLPLAVSRDVLPLFEVIFFGSVWCDRALAPRRIPRRGEGGVRSAGEQKARISGRAKKREGLKMSNLHEVRARTRAEESAEGFHGDRRENV